MPFHLCSVPVFLKIHIVSIVPHWFLGPTKPPLLLLGQRAGRTSMADNQRAGTLSSTKARSRCVSDHNVCHYKKSQLFLTPVAFKALRHSPICALGKQTRFCFYFAAQVSKHPCDIRVLSPATITPVPFGLTQCSLECYLSLVTPLPPRRSCSAIHTPPTCPPHDLLGPVSTAVLR